MHCLSRFRSLVSYEQPGVSRAHEKNINKKEGDTIDRRHGSRERADRQSTEALQEKVRAFWNFEGIQKKDVLYEAFSSQANEACKSYTSLSEVCVGSRLIRKKVPSNDGIFFRRISIVCNENEESRIAWSFSLLENELREGALLKA